MLIRSTPANEKKNFNEQLLVLQMEISFFGSDFDSEATSAICERPEQA